MLFRWSVISLLLLSAATLRAQVQTDLIIEQIIEAYAETQAEDIDYSELAEKLNAFIKKPLDLNSVSEDELKDLIFLSAMQQQALLDHIDRNGKLMEWYELQSIDGFDVQTIERMMLFASITTTAAFERFNFGQLVRQGGHELMLRYGQILQEQEGYVNGRYLGSQQKYLLRYRYAFGNTLKVSVNMEKDPGEVFFGQGKGFDFYSGSLYYRGKGWIGNACIGDYNLQFGQGLALWTGMGFGSGVSVSGIIKQQIGLSPYTSVNEALFLRGAAVTFRLNRFSVTPFISYRKLDATLTDSGEIKTLGQSGLHRTVSELNAMNAVGQLVFGTNVHGYFGKLQVGATAYQTRFNKAFAPGDDLYNQFEFSGSMLTNLSVNYNYRYRNIYTFGEAAHSQGNGFAYLAGLVSNLSHRMSVVMAYRNYQKNYHSFYNQGMSQASNAVNEKGFYVGLEYKAGSKVLAGFFADRFSFPWLKFGVDAPSRGYSVSGQLIYTPSKRLKIIGRYRLLHRQENDDTDNVINILEDVDKANYRLELTYFISRGISLRNRVEAVEYRKGNTENRYGFIAYQDIIYNPLQSKFSGNIRFALFDTDGFATRIYTYENDVLYGYSLGAYQDSGLRAYINLRYTFSRAFDAWVRYSQTSYLNKDLVSSGNDEIAGNIRSDIRLQLRLRF